MTIPEIISLLDADRIPDALWEVDKIRFSNEDTIVYKRKREKYYAGDELKGQALLDWIRQMKVFLRTCKCKETGNHWYHLDKKITKDKFQNLLYAENALKVIFIEANESALSQHLPDILYLVHFRNDKTLGDVKGDINDEIIFLDEIDNINNKWAGFVQRMFGLSKQFPQLIEEFKEQGLHKQPHFVIQSVENFDAENFDVYHGLWKKLEPEKPIILCFYLTPHSLSSDSVKFNCLCCSGNEDSFVDKTDFTRFFKKFEEFYNDDLNLGDDCRMTFAEAVKKIKECEK
ncbi:MAG: hypothetical protein WCI64_09350 [Chlorobium sp.]